MMDLLQSLFGKKLTAESNTQEPTHDLRVATCALLLEMADIDGRFSESERQRIVGILRKEYGLAAEDIEGLMEASKEQLDQSIDYWHFTNLINQNYSMEEKIRIIEMVWKIAYTDGKLDQHEDYLIHKLANLLRLSHKQLIDAKLRIVHGT
jgi:uncharacterized tellurite resistance protein B-like protein